MHPGLFIKLAHPGGNRTLALPCKPPGYLASRQFRPRRPAENLYIALRLAL
jgi:hypothetical protein